MATQNRNEELESFLVENLELITDADPKTLTPYILALLHKPKKYCAEQLRDFLHEETEPFVEKLFEFLQKLPKTKRSRDEKDKEKKEKRDKDRKRKHEHSEKDGERKRKKERSERHRSDRHKSSPNKGKETVLISADGTTAERPPPPGYNEPQSSSSKPLGQVSMGRRKEVSNGKQGDDDDFAVPLSDSIPSGPNHTIPMQPPMMGNMHPMGMNNGQSDLILQSRGPPHPGTPVQLQRPMQPPPPPPDQRYPFPPRMVDSGMGHLTYGGPPPPGNAGNSHMGSYRPPHGQMTGPPPGHPMHRMPMDPPMRPPDHGGRHDWESDRPMPMGRPRFQPPPLNNRPPGRDHQGNNTLLVSNIPIEYNNIARLSAHFERFGVVMNIHVSHLGESALVTYQDGYQAAQALESPDAVCGNRFIQTSIHNPNNPGPSQHHQHGQRRVIRGPVQEQSLQEDGIERAPQGPVRRVSLQGHGEQRRTDELARSNSQDALKQEAAKKAETLKFLEDKKAELLARSQAAAALRSKALEARNQQAQEKLKVQKGVKELLDKKTQAVETALNKCKKRLAEIGANPAIATPEERRELMNNIRALGTTLKGIAEQRKKVMQQFNLVVTQKPAFKPSSSTPVLVDGSREEADAGHDEESKEPTTLMADIDDDAESILYVRPFPSDWTNNEEDVKFHFTTTTSRTPTDVEFNAQYIKVVLPGTKTAESAMKESVEYCGQKLGLSLTLPEFKGNAHLPELTEPADEEMLLDSDDDEEGHQDTGGASAREDDDPDRSWKR